MLICIGGLPGSGRNRLSEAVARELGFTYTHFHHIKRLPSLLALHRATNPAKRTPYSDELLTLVYRKATENLPRTAKMYPDLIMKDHFCREAPREFLFKEGEKSYGPPLVVWNDATYKMCEKRLREIDDGKDPKHLERHLAILDGLHEAFQSFTRPVLTVSFIADQEGAVRAISGAVRERRGY